MSPFHEWMESFDLDIPAWLFGGDYQGVSTRMLSLIGMAGLAEHEGDHEAAEWFRFRAGYGGLQ